MIEDEVLHKMPFINIIKHNEVELVGLIQNYDDKILSFYDFSSLKSDDMKELFLKFCDEWWYESNRMLPINIFIGKDMRLFRSCLKTFNKKEVDILHGPATSLSNILKKRIKRRQISLIAKN
jgi:hypothetical protein